MGFLDRCARGLLAFFLATSLVLGAALAGTWIYVVKLLREPLALTPPPVRTSAPVPVSPLLVRYELDLPGRGEIFPALVSASDYWPVAVLRITNTADSPVLQTISAEVEGWSLARLLGFASSGKSSSRSLHGTLTTDSDAAVLLNNPIANTLFLAGDIATRAAITEPSTGAWPAAGRRHGRRWQRSSDKNSR